MALAATLLAAACVRTRRDQVTGRVAVDAHSPLQKGTVWDATLTGQDTYSGVAGTTRADVLNGQTTLAARVTGLTPGATHPSSVHEGRCNTVGAQFGEASAYRPLLVNNKGVAEGTARLPALDIARKYKIRLFVSPTDTTPEVVCGGPDLPVSTSGGASAGRRLALASLLTIMLPACVGRRHVAPVRPLDAASAPMKSQSRRGAPDHDAEDPRRVQPERPSVATHAGTVARGYAEIDSAVERDRHPDGTVTTLEPTVLKLGLARRVQLSLMLPTERAMGTAFGIGDVAAGVKWRLTEDHPVLHELALLPQLKLPTGGDRGTGTTDANLLLIDSRIVGAASLDLNVGVTRRSGDGTRAPRTSALWAVAAAIPVQRALGLTLEVFGYPGTTGPAGSAPIIGLTMAPTFTLGRTLTLDAGLMTTLHGPQPHVLFIGLVTNVGRLH